MINRVVLVGRLTKDPELRKTTSGVSVTSFTLAIDDRYSKEENKANFFNCVVFNKQAENTELYCKKGSLVGIEGRLNQRSYDNKDGYKVNVVEVLCDAIQFLEPKEKQQQEPSKQQTSYNPYNGLDIIDDDLPF